MSDGPFRALDANLNRAREALRLIEDYARFTLDDQAVAGALKGARHALRGIRERLGPDRLRNARDIESDVGRDLKTADEGRREDPAGVVAAAFARLSEALRVISEFSKLECQESARQAETLRYQCYEWEMRMLSRGEARKRFRDARLYVLLTESLCRAGWRETAEAALRGGAQCLQLREKDWPDGRLLERAAAVRELTHQYEALFIMNDRPDLARLVDADGVHLGQDDLPVREARRILGPTRLIGKSAHCVAQVEAASAEGADYIAVGAMFPSGAKPEAGVAGPKLLVEAAACTDLPLVAIGGVTVERAGELRRLGASSVCVCSAVINADDPQAAAGAFREALR